MWAAPPGGFDRSTRRKERWRAIRAATAAILSVNLLVGAGVYATMKESTPVSAETALAEFRSNPGGEADTAAPKSGGKATKERKTPAKHAHKGRPSDKTVAAASASGTSAVSVPETGTGDEAGETHTTHREAGSATPDFDRPPREGVYTWEVDGYEDAPGVHRELPSRSQRVLTIEENGHWTEHHIFSEQREEWFFLSASEEGVALSASRNRVEMGPVTEDKTVYFDPPVFVSRFPFEVGQTWSGSWSGKTSGEYSGKTIDHGFLTIGGERVEVYATEVVMHTRGEVSGDIVTRSWVSPKYRLVVKQYQDMTVDAGPGNYRSEWTGTLVSLDPQT